MKRLLSAALGFFISGLAMAHDVQLTATLDGAARPSIVGHTNLPEGTKISTNLVCPLMYCATYWGGASQAVVHGDSFVSGPFSIDGKPLPQGEYVINVVVLDDQDPSVIASLADLGWSRTDTMAFHFKVGITGGESKSDLPDPTQSVSSLSNSYAQAIREAITHHWLRPDDLSPGPCDVNITQLPGGRVVNIVIAPECPYDEAGQASVVNAVLHSQPLPYRGFESVFRRNITFTFRAR